MIIFMVIINHFPNNFFYFLLMQNFHRDLPPTPVFAYGTSAETATFPGPTIIARHGVPLYVKWENQLPDHHILPTDNTIYTAITTMGGVPTVVHLHGSIHPPQSDGSPFAWFTRDYKEVGPKWTQTTYMYPNIQPPRQSLVRYLFLKERLDGTLVIVNFVL